MDTMKHEILKDWLEIDFYYIANRLNFIAKKKTVDEDLIYKTIRWLDYESIMARQPQINYIITIVGLMWEHVDRKHYDLRPLVIKFLSRIGYPTSAIICDKEFNDNNCSFSKLNSWLDELVLTMYQSANEVIILNHCYLLTDFQKQIWNSLENDKILGISAPTSAGKSFVILLYLIKKLSSEFIDVLYIVPTLSLINQVTEDFNRIVKKFKIDNCIITNNFVLDSYEQHKLVYVLTQEKAMEALVKYENSFSKRLILVADEIQNIERMTEDDDERAKILFDTLLELGHKDNVIQIIISGPRIDNISNVGKCIFGENTISHITKISPVINLTYSIKKNNANYYLKQYCPLTDSPIIKKIENASIIKGYGKIRLSDDYLFFLDKFVDNIGTGTQNIIFASTSKSARKIATRLKSSCITPEYELIKYYKDTVHDNYSLCNTLLNGVAYHHGKLPMHVRRTLEKAIHDNKVSKIVCTTTLLQGVNLPAQNIFIRNPHLYLKKRNNSPELTAYEMANLRGRAGRLLKEFIGRTFVLDEDSFYNTKEFENDTFFGDITKVLPTGYEKIFQDNHNRIEDSLLGNNYVGTENKDYGYLISYIRQNVLRYGDKAQSKLSKVGIGLTPEQIAAINSKLNLLTIPKRICYQNRYWDPLVLNFIYNNFKGTSPNTPYDPNANKQLSIMLSYLRDTPETSILFEKNIPRKYRKGPSFYIMINLCIKWAQGVELKELLAKAYYKEDEDKIDETIDLLQATISFKIPHLLKPIFDIKNPKSIFISCMRTGATSTTARTMIEMGIARETALYLYNHYFKSISLSGNTTTDYEKAIRDTLKNIYSILPYWIQIQLDYLL